LAVSVGQACWPGLLPPWGSAMRCAGLPVPLSASEARPRPASACARFAACRNVGQAGSLRGGCLPPLSGASAAVGRLTIGRSLPSRPTKAPCLAYTYAQIPPVLLMNRAGLHFFVAHPPAPHAWCRGPPGPQPSGAPTGSAAGMTFTPARMLRNPIRDGHYNGGSVGDQNPCQSRSTPA
jgi:hypothetical protein